MRIYSSPDLNKWKYESSFGKEYGCHGGVWECPDLFPIGQSKKWVLICNINPGGPFGGSATQYFVGQFDRHKFTCEHQDTRWMDYGKDHYATVSFCRDCTNLSGMYYTINRPVLLSPRHHKPSGQSIPKSIHVPLSAAGHWKCSWKPPEGNRMNCAQSCRMSTADREKPKSRKNCSFPSILAMSLPLPLTSRITSQQEMI